MDNIAVTDSVITYRNGDLKDILFQNRVAGQIATVVASATIPTDYVKQMLKW